MLLYFQTLSTLYLEANHKVPSSGFQVLSMSESDFSELVAPHETDFVEHLAVYSVEFALTRILHISKSLPSRNTGMRFIYRAIISL